MEKNIDEKIISLLYTDPEEGMTLLMEEYMGLLQSACSLYLNNPEDLRECVQETLLDFYANLHHFDRSKGSLKAYLYTIAKRKAIRMAVKNGKLPEPLMDEALLTDDEDWVEKLTTQSVLEEALAKLKPEDNRIIRMKYFEGKTCAEIAHELQLSPEAVKKRHQRSLKKLRRILVVFLIVALLSACAVIVTSHLRFSPATGFQQDGEETSWYEMSGGPMHVETEQGEVVIESVIWKASDVYVEALFINEHLEDEVYSTGVGLYSEDRSWVMPHLGLFVQHREGEPVRVKYKFYYLHIEDELMLDVLGEACVVKMTPIGQYEDIQNIGVSQTHRGRTIVLKETRKADSEKTVLSAYTCSDGPWKICAIEEWQNQSWETEGLLSGEYVFRYIGPGGDFSTLDELKITEVCLAYRGEIEPVAIPVPKEEGTETVDIPFTVGEDLYRVTEVRRSQYWDELFVTVEPVKVEENTVAYRIRGRIGGDPTWLEPSTLIGDGTSSRITVSASLDCNGEDPEEILFEIDTVYKIWKQAYQFDLR